MRAVIVGQWLPEIARTVGIGGFIGLLIVVTVSCQISIQITGKNLIRDDRLQRRHTDVELAPSMVRCPVDSACGNFGLKNRWYRLRLARQPAFDPVELWGIQGRQLNHGQVNVDVLMQQLGPDRICKSSYGVLRAAIGGL